MTEQNKQRVYNAIKEIEGLCPAAVSMTGTLMELTKQFQSRNGFKGDSVVEHASSHLESVTSMFKGALANMLEKLRECKNLIDKNDRGSGKKVDQELVQVIDDAMANSKDDTEALNKVLDFLKVHREMKGWHVSVDPDFAAKPDMDMATKTKTLAHEVLMMLREEALGRLEKVDLEELGRRPEDNEFCPKVLKEVTSKPL